MGGVGEPPGGHRPGQPAGPSGRAGAAAVQIFESWGGALSPADYGRHVLPAFEDHPRRPGARWACPGSFSAWARASCSAAFAEAGADVVGVDWRVPLDVARTRVGAGVALQGNLDPTACLAPWPVLADQARAVLAVAGDKGHVFNLGHGVLPATDPDQLARLVDLVHTETERR